MKDSLGDRIKEYESVPSLKLTRRTPVIVRLDGKAFHSWVKKAKCEKPFDNNLIRIMQGTTAYLCKNVQGCRIGYCQSDEITLLLIDYGTLESDAYYDNSVQKICSVTSSMATAYFNNLSLLIFANSPLAMFDSRCFNVPKEEVNNTFLWRQQDASRNSVQMLARSFFSHKECENKNNSELQDMMMEKHNVNWNELETYKKRGTCVYKKLGENNKPEWFIDKNIPIFSQEKDFVGKWVQSRSVEELLIGE